MTESLFSQIEHHLTFVAVLSMVGFALNQHKIWTRLKDRVNQLWYRRCEETGELYEPLENGKR